MNLFLVALDDDNASPDEVNTRVSEHYKSTSYRLSKLTWVIANGAASPVEICQKLGIDKQSATEQQATGVVALINDYSGYADKGLWQLMRGWQAS